MSDPLVPVAEPYVSCITPPDGVPIVVAHPHTHPTAQHTLHWSTSTTSSEHHQHLSQHLASRGHRLLSLSTGGVADTTQQVAASATGNVGKSARTKSPEVAERKESPRK
uniref:Uncharacterized protein n=2 Tax=Ceratitis capitata TaxID=7213 RepID=W8BX12_CERCA